ncbi:MAG: ammonia-forming cytochrome c nitrite reductase subunit c552 [Methanomassiliicoccales archaeon]|nr:MAG: ammonia-forming cytochrome c nitrite reductase subunit c552 [Methanomassiliicoccales archaeon]
MNRRNAVLIFGILAIVAVIAIVAAADSDEERGTRAGETYVGSEVCNGCKHASTTNEYVNWSETAHAIDFANNWTYRGNYLNKYIMEEVAPHVYENASDDLPGDCAICHVVGYNETDIGGFDPDEVWNSTNNSKLLRIGCENCHGPGSGHAPSPPGTASKNTINLGPDRYYEACGGTAQAECHGGYRQWGNESISGWNVSLHAPWENDPEEDDGMNNYCARCKSPSQWDPTTNRTVNDDIPKAEYRGITCGDCHDPHPDPDNTHEYQLRWELEEVCDACHNGGHHETMRTAELNSEPSVNRTDYPYMEEVTCAECHMWSSSRDLRGTEYEHVGHGFEATIDACLECHSTIFEDIPKTTDTVNWTAWETYYDENYTQWHEVVEAAQERHKKLNEEVSGLIDIIAGIEDDDHNIIQRGLMDKADENGTWTEHLEELFEQAEYDWELADHASTGSHNPAYGIALLNAAKLNLTEIIEELSVGVLKGNVTDESNAGIADVYISVNGHGTKTASDGTYTLTLAPGTYTVTAIKAGTIEQSASDVVITAPGVTKQDFTLAPDFDGDGTPDSTDTDDDNDGLPDSWETNNSLDPKDPSDAYEDDDNDGMTNYQEYMDQTDPQDANDFKKTGEEDDEEEDNMIYLVIIIVLIIVIVLLGLLFVMKGKGAPAPTPEPEPEPEPEEAVEEEAPAEEEPVEETGAEEEAPMEEGEEEEI